MNLGASSISTLSRRSRDPYPSRIVVLGAEAADWLYRLDAWERVVGVTTYFRPKYDVEPRPRVGGFQTPNVERILELRPDLVILHSDVQAELASLMARRGLPVVLTTQSTLQEITDQLLMIARIVGRESVGEELLCEWWTALEPRVRSRAPRVYFEEWPDPIITGIGWIGELIERAGGNYCFAHLQGQKRAEDRRVRTEDVLHASPEIILISWCGKRFELAKLLERPGWQTLPAVRDGAIHEIPGEIVLQPGLGLAEGYAVINEILDDYLRCSV